MSTGRQGLAPAAVSDLGGTVQSAYRAMARAFARAKFETPQSDARFLLQGLLQRPAADIVLGGEIPLTADEIARLQAALRRRLASEPVSRILGLRSFYGRDFVITPDVLDPRPDTETVVDAALELARSSDVPADQLRIADIGVGSGAILLTLLAKLPQARGVGTDVSPGALAVAQRNAERLGVAGRLELVETDGLDGVGGPLHIVVSNPPYIASRDIQGLSQDVKCYDPLLALDGGPDGLAVYRKIASNIKELRQDSAVAVEVGAGQAEAVKALLKSALEGRGKVQSRLWKDLGGHIRCVTVKRHS
ncbi:MAG: peptide chain release factor N(5)-glutamine methyltransferase [Hyphomicrobium sp.]|nr:peptide chain release factor N(5)-glutamine methyltransferase [Hyphomicrobium sp.]